MRDRAGQTLGMRTITTLASLTIVSGWSCIGSELAEAPMDLDASSSSAETAFPPPTPPPASATSEPLPPRPPPAPPAPSPPSARNAAAASNAPSPYGAAGSPPSAPAPTAEDPPAGAGVRTSADTAPQKPPAADLDVRRSNPYRFPVGGAVDDAPQRIETVRQLIDRLGQDALAHEARMTGRQPDVMGRTDVDVEKEHATYITSLRTNHRRMRLLMHEVARCPNASPDRPVADASAPVQQLAREIDRYASTTPTAREASRHVRNLRPLIVRWKSVYVDPSDADEASKPEWQVPPQVKRSWCTAP